MAPIIQHYIKTCVRALYLSMAEAPRHTEPLRVNKKTFYFFKTRIIRAARTNPALWRDSE